MGWRRRDGDPPLIVPRPPYNNVRVTFFLKSL